MEDLPEIPTERLLLRPFRFDDVDDVFAYATHPEWARHLPVPVPYARPDAEEFVARCILADPENRLEWAVVHEGSVSGGVTLIIQRPGTAELGYSLARPLWGEASRRKRRKPSLPTALRSLG